MSSETSETRTRILEAAWQLLEAEQTKTTRMTDIAKRAGVSRQAVYLHFGSRADLLIATTRYVDGVKDIDARLAPSRAAATGIDRLDAYIEAWCDYIPEIYGVMSALLAMQDTDEAAALACKDRMRAVRDGCEAALRDLERDANRAPGRSLDDAIDLLRTMLSVRNWEQLTIECGWTQADYVQTIKSLARQIFVVDGVR